MESEVIQPPTEIKKVDRFGFFEEDTGRSRLIRRLFRIEPVFDVKLENQRLHKWLDMLKNLGNVVCVEFPLRRRFCQEKPEVIKRRVHKGIPDAVRGRVWSIFLSADVCSDVYQRHAV